MKRISKINKIEKTENDLRQNNQNSKKNKKEIQEFNTMLQEEQRKITENKEEQDKKIRPLDIYKYEIQKSKPRFNKTTEKSEEQEQEQEEK